MRKEKNGEPAGIRTLDHRLKRAMLYRLSYQLTLSRPFPGQGSYYNGRNKKSKLNSKKK